MEDRDCKTCIHHTDDGCTSWECEYVSREEADKAVKAVRGEQDGYCNNR